MRSIISLILAVSRGSFPMRCGSISLIPAKSCFLWAVNNAPCQLQNQREIIISNTYEESVYVCVRPSVSTL